MQTSMQWLVVNEEKRREAEAEEESRKKKSLAMKMTVRRIVSYKSPSK